MKRIRTELVIAAPVARVFAMLADFANWSSWNPVIPSIRGRAAVGSRVAFKIVIPGLVPLPLVAKVTTCEPDRKLAWSGGMRGVFHGEHYFELEPTTGGTRLVHGEDFSGAFARLMPDRLVHKIEAAYGAANLALAGAITPPSARS